MYGLGSESENLPAYIVMLEGSIKAGPPAYGSGFLPAMYQGTTLRAGSSPLLNIKRPEQITADEQREMLDLLKNCNERHLASRRDEPDLSARIESYELAFRMQMAAPEFVDLSKESEATKKLYGMGDPVTDDFGTKCLLARRLVERGVRFVQLYSGSGNGADWDGHNQCDKNHQGMARKVDKPIAGSANRPESAWLARQHARDLGRRIWSYPDDRRECERRIRRRARSQSVRLQHLACGRRCAWRKSNRRD